MATQPQTGLTYDDLLRFPEDNFRRELIDGELIVTAAPGGRHQDSVLVLGAAFLSHCKEHGGKVYVAPRDVYFKHDTVLEPDVIYVAPDQTERVEERFVRGGPAIVVEVSSPTTRRLELVRKREVFERFGVPEYWYVDLDAERVEIYRRQEGGYGAPTMLERGERLTSALVPGFAIAVDEVLGPPPEDEQS